MLLHPTKREYCLKTQYLLPNLSGCLVQEQELKVLKCEIDVRRPIVPIGKDLHKKQHHLKLWQFDRFRGFAASRHFRLLPAPWYIA
ncbi:hypothetical protein D3C80_1217670 [compost metagenome]